MVLEGVVLLPLLRPRYRTVLPVIAWYVANDFVDYALGYYPRIPDMAGFAPVRAFALGSTVVLSLVWLFWAWRNERALRRAALSPATADSAVRRTGSHDHARDARGRERPPEHRRTHEPRRRHAVREHAHPAAGQPDVALQQADDDAVAPRTHQQLPQQVGAEELDRQRAPQRGVVAREVGTRPDRNPRLTAMAAACPLSSA